MFLPTAIALFSQTCHSTFDGGIGSTALRLITVPRTSRRPSRSVTLPSGRPGQLIRDRRRSVGDAELALRDHLEPRPLEVEGLRNTAPAVCQRRRALIEVVLRAYEGTVRIVRRDQAETDDLGRQV